MGQGKGICAPEEFLNWVEEEEMEKAKLQEAVFSLVFIEVCSLDPSHKQSISREERNRRARQRIYQGAAVPCEQAGCQGQMVPNPDCKLTF